MDTKKLEALSKVSQPIDLPTKLKLHQAAKVVLKQLANELGLTVDQYEIRSNKGGIAVVGEIILHTENLYVTIGGDSGSLEVMFRSCSHRKDYTGGRNQWTSVAKLNDNLDKFKEIQWRQK